MPVDFQQIHARIEQIGAGAVERQRLLDERRRKAQKLLSDHASDLDLLRRKVETARTTDPSIRCAVPVDEPLSSSHPCPPVPADVTLIAADGSQINPDRHAALQFGVVNVGAVTMRLRSGEVPLICTNSNLLYGEDLETDFGSISEAMVALRRDLREREVLEELSSGLPGAVVTFTDGPIELWGAKGEDQQNFERFVEKYKGVLSRLQSRSVVNAGYVEHPGADLVVRLLEFSAIPEDDLKQLQVLRKAHPLRGVGDLWLYGSHEDPVIPPGHRSAVFGLQSGSQHVYTGALALHFFYLNVGSTGHPWLVRVEIPQWVAAAPLKLDLLHAVLVEQCGIMGNKPYPYLLHRAHETAVVRHEEKAQVEQMLMQELMRHGEPMHEKSHKQTAKDLPGRKSI
jgi:hypothetical protein